jgi:predicted metal-binding protein
MRQKKLIDQIRENVKKGKVKEPFKVSDFTCLNKSKSFLSKHAVGNGKYTEYFIRVERGKYKLNKNL